MVTQINLKFQDDFYELAKEYANAKGYMSVQELVREALRDKIFENLEINSTYLQTLSSKDATTFNSIADSKAQLAILRERAKNERLQDK